MWKFRSTELYHYSSPYYDPKKAHEYYEEHKKLKGRSSTSTAGLNDNGKKAASYVKSQIDEQKQKALESESKRYSEETKQRQEQKKKTIEQHSKVLSQRINSLSAALKRMTPAQRESEAPRIKAIIYKLREANNKKRAELEKNHLTAQNQAALKSAETKAQIRADYDAEYERELGNISADSSMRAAKKSK